MFYYEKLVKHITYPLLSRRYGYGGVCGHLREFEKRQYLPREELLEYQWKKVREILEYAYHNTDYYNRRFNEYGAEPWMIKDPSDMEKLPILTKTDIRENLEAMISRRYSRSELIPSSTGGTTGVKINFFYARDSLPAKKAAEHRADKWTGWDLGKRKGIIWPAGQDYVGCFTTRAKIKNALLEREIILPAAVLDEEMIRNYILLLKKHKPRMIRGFPNSIFLVADYINQNDIHLDFNSNVISTGEPLYDHHKKAFAKAFHGEIFNSYSAREVSLIGQECEKHNGLHLNMECNFVEFMTGTGPARCGEIGDIIVTDLVNRGMPLIRYQIGDKGVPEEGQCECGRGLSLLGSVMGRDGDIFKLPNGNRVAAITLVLYLVDNGPMVGKVQVIQDRIDHLTVKITDDPMPDGNVFAFYRKTINGLLGPEMKVDFTIVEDIPKEASGKYRFVKCEI